ncbi:MAG: hypothetical protein J6Y02_03790 [Pseudobutyrivibrio sp.]|nr:hypothetical protein [Pseudobutyrivibrio sp.]
MSTFSDWNGPQNGTSANAMIKFANAYEDMKRDLNAHKDEELTNEAHDPHKTKAYIDQKVKSISDKASENRSAISCMLKRFAGIDNVPVTVQDIIDHIKSKIGDDTDLISFVMTLVARIETLEAELNTLSLIQFDNVPVGAGIRWYRDTLPEDGTFVWANGQTLYGVNQNFPELARVWEIGSADNVKVPKEDHTIFKVRKADRKIQAIQHAYIEPVSGDATVDFTNRLESITSQLTALQQAVDNLSNP